MAETIDQQRHKLYTAFADFAGRKAYDTKSNIVLSENQVLV